MLDNFRINNFRVIHQGQFRKSLNQEQRIFDLLKIMLTGTTRSQIPSIKLVSFGLAPLRKDDMRRRRLS